MKLIAPLFFAGLMAAGLPIASSLAGPSAGAVPSHLTQSKPIVVAASQCDTNCSARYTRCAEKVAADFNAGKLDDLEPYYEDCSNQLQSCRSSCINQGECISSDDGEVVCP
jgi:curli biogenesis system outer membrane secretion channel CsgG